MAFSDELQNFWSGKPTSNQQIPLLNPQQTELQSQLINQVSPMVQNMGQNKFDFEPIANKARMDFQSKTLPSIASRFARFGNQRGSDYKYALSSAGAGLDSNLGALRSQVGLQQSGQEQQMLLSLLSLLLRPQSENLVTPHTQGLNSALGGGLGGFLGSLTRFGLGSLFGL